MLGKGTDQILIELLHYENMLFVILTKESTHIHFRPRFMAFSCRILLTPGVLPKRNIRAPSTSSLCKRNEQVAVISLALLMMKVSKTTLMPIQMRCMSWALKSSVRKNPS